jgi:glycosyltransferase involved in cell wall biosynthesis
MRVLHVVSRSQRRGAERAALDLSDALAALGHDNDIVALVRAFDGSERPELPALTRRSRLRATSFPFEVRALRRELKQRPVDVVLAHGGRAAQVAVLARGRSGPRVVWQRILGFHESIARPPRRWWWSFVVRRIDASVALTEELAEEVRAMGLPGPVWVIENFRDPSRFVGLDRATQSRRLRSALGIDANAPVIGFVGHLVEQKRPDRALEVLAEVHRLGASSAHLVIAGDGPLRHNVEREVRTRGLDEYVHLLGNSDNVEEILAGIDVFVLTSDDEGIPGVVIEAEMAGCCVVAPDIGGVAGVVRNGKTGIVSPSRDAVEIARHVYDALSDAPRRERMGAQARDDAKRFSSQTAARHYEMRLQTLVLPAHSV